MEEEEEEEEEKKKKKKKKKKEKKKKTLSILVAVISIKRPTVQSVRWYVFSGHDIGNVVPSISWHCDSYKTVV